MEELVQNIDLLPLNLRECRYEGKQCRDADRNNEACTRNEEGHHEFQPLSLY